MLHNAPTRQDSSSNGPGSGWLLAGSAPGERGPERWRTASIGSWTTAKERGVAGLGQLNLTG
jgi:hypothetical protein